MPESDPASASLPRVERVEVPPSPMTGERVTEILKRLGPTGPLAILALTGPIVGGILLLTYIATISAWLQAQGPMGPVIYAVAFIVLAGFAVLPTWSQAVLAGWAFGMTTGTIAGTIGYAGAALSAYFTARFVSGSRVTDLINENPKWAAVHQALTGGGFWKTLGLVMLLRMPPNSPFAATNLVMAATRVSVVPYTIGTVIGMLPRTMIAIFVGATWKDAYDEHKPWWLIAVSIVFAFIIVGVISQIANHAVARVTAAQAAANQATAHATQDDASGGAARDAAADGPQSPAR